MGFPHGLAHILGDQSSHYKVVDDAKTKHNLLVDFENIVNHLDETITLPKRIYESQPIE